MSGVVGGVTASDVIWVCSNTAAEVYRVEIPDTGTPTTTLTLTNAGYVRPFGVAVRSNGDLLVNSRGPCTACVGGSLTRQPVTACLGLPAAGATVTGGLTNPHDVAVVGDTAYMIDSYGAKISRYSLAGTGAPVLLDATTGIPNGGGRCLVVHPQLGEMFLSDVNSDSILRYRINPDGSLTPNGSFTAPGMFEPHGLTIASDGELFVCSATSPGAIFRFRFDAAGTATPNGQITGNSMNTPMSTVWTSAGEMIVINHVIPLASRFAFNAARVASANGTFAIPSPGGDSVRADDLGAMVASPSAVRSCPKGTVQFTVVGVTGAGFTFRWQREQAPGVWANLSDGASAGNATVAGATSSVLSLSTLPPSGTLRVRCVVTTSCGQATTNPARLEITCASAGDVAGLGGGAACDGEFTADDIVVYLAAFFAGNLAIADVTSLGGGTGADGQLTPDDIIGFLAGFFAGCP